VPISDAVQPGHVRVVHVAAGAEEGITSRRSTLPIAQHFQDQGDVSAIKQADSKNIERIYGGKGEWRGRSQVQPHRGQGIQDSENCIDRSAVRAITNPSTNKRTQSDQQTTPGAGYERHLSTTGVIVRTDARNEILHRAGTDRREKERQAKPRAV